MFGWLRSVRIISPMNRESCFNIFATHAQKGKGELNMRKRFALPLDLQLFAETIDEDGLIDFGDDDDDVSGTTIDDYNESLEDAEEQTDDLKFYALEDDDDDVPIEEQVESEPEPEQEQEQEQEPETNVEPEKSKKRVQTPEENARFAEMRRQEQLRKQLEQTPEYQLAKALESTFGMPADALLKQVQEEQLKRQAKEQNVPVEVLRAQQEQAQLIQQLQQQLLQQQFEAWRMRVDNEMAQLKEQYKMLSEEDFLQARQYMLEVLKNPDVPLEQVVFALHGKKIADHLKESVKQEAIAEVSGRKKKNLIPPSASKAKTTPYDELTPEEIYVAKQMGLTPEEYLKYKT